MENNQLSIAQIVKTENIPYKLLLIADPSKEQVDSYLKKGICFSAKLDNEVVGVLVLLSINKDIIEIKNIAVEARNQGKGIGRKLLDYAIDKSKRLGFQRIRIATGNSSIRQLMIYQKTGFEMERIKRNFFVDNYDEPIYENGIQCKHLVVLEKML